MIFRIRAILFCFVAVSLFSHCARKIYVRQTPYFSPEKMHTVAIVTDFVSSKGGTVNINRSRNSGAKLAAEISKQLRVKRYHPSGPQLASVGLYFENQISVIDERGEKATYDPPVYVDKDIDQNREIEEALRLSFIRIDQMMAAHKGKKVEEKFLYNYELYIEEEAKLLGQYLGADTLLFLYAWETKKTDAAKLGYALGYGAGMALTGALTASTYKTDYYEPDMATIVGIYAGVGFLWYLLMNPDGYTACCGILVDAESGEATWYNFSHWASGGMSGDQLGRIAKDLLKRLPDRR